MTEAHRDIEHLWEIVALDRTIVYMYELFGYLKSSHLFHFYITYPKLKIGVAGETETLEFIIFGRTLRHEK